MSHSFFTFRDLAENYLNNLHNVQPIRSKYKFMDRLIDSPAIISIVARPQTGKTMLKDLIIEDLLDKNKDLMPAAYDFQLELTKTEIMKRFMYRKGLDPYNEQHVRIAAQHLDHRIIFNNSASDIDSFMREATQYIKAYPNSIIAIDHALILSNGGELMSALYKRLVELKKLNAYIIVLSQLNRNIVSEKRVKDESNMAKIYESDIYGSDVIMQYSDIVIALDRPALRGISIYSKAAIPCHQNTLFVQFLKNRNSPILGWYQYELTVNMNIQEVAILHEISRDGENNIHSHGYNEVAEQEEDIKEPDEDLDF